MISTHYFDRYAYPERFIKEPIRKDTFVAVVIPVYKEENLLLTLQSLVDCEQTKFPVEVILVVNHPVDAHQSIKELSYQTVRQIENFTANNPSNLAFHVIEAFDLPPKKAGVGLARKIGMDEAAFRFNSINQDGVILCFDADSQCDKNYLKEIEAHFINNPHCNGASIHYEHPVHLESGEINEAIVWYELHLRYYIQALKYANYPFSFHTIGSSMAAKSSIYQKQGGMNTRKAGEDFYFLHKIIPLGDFHTITSTKVIPSARTSDRVPFGTGRAMQEHQEQANNLGLSYDLRSFTIIKAFLEKIDSAHLIENAPSEIKGFLEENKLYGELENIKSQSTNETHFKTRFFEWFNGFKMLKLVHFLRDYSFPEQSLEVQSSKLLQQLGREIEGSLSAVELLEIYREMDAS